MQRNLLGLFLFLCFGGSLVYSQLHHEVICGQKKCSLMEYCSDVDRTCAPCSRICNKSHHNYEPKTCEKSCQDYLHDERYVRKDEEDESLRFTVQKLSKMISVTLTLTCFTLVVLFALLVFLFYRWTKKKNITIATIKNHFFRKKSRDNTPKSNETHNMETKKPDLRLDMPTSDTISDHSPVTVTTSISRRPTEDSTLAYAYDNPAMSNTPSPHGKSSNTSF